MLSPLKSFIVSTRLLFPEYQEYYFLPLDYSVEAREYYKNDFPIDYYWFPIGSEKKYLSVEP